MRMLQDEAEIARFCVLLASEGVASYLEIGSKFGGSLRRVASVLPRGSRIVSVDLPLLNKPGTNRALTDTVAGLIDDGFDAHLIWGDSTDPRTVEMARVLGPFDAVMIDADHRLPAVEADWSNYGPLGTMVAFHDIAWQRAPTWDGIRIDVPQVWDRLKADHRHEEIKLCPTGKNNGIGVLWRSIS